MPALAVGCAALTITQVGFGYVVLDLLLPLLLAGILINAYIPFIGTLLRLTGQVITIAVDYTMKAAEKTAELVDKL